MSVSIITMWQRQLTAVTVEIKAGISGAVKRSTRFRKEKPRVKEARERVIKAKAKAINKVRAKEASKDHATGVVSMGIVSETAL